ncbi:MAG: hypothetical protein OXG11_09105, partial [Chloroflexi bacterium]|nr:hypothetical protein [Chloroflexota bacterium]
MTMWPDVCYCTHCTARFWSEHDAEPPRIVDWNDPAWRKFQSARQAWLLDFVNEMTRTVKQIRPISVYHQFATVFHSWQLGAPLELAEACDFVTGDFYGGPASHSLVCKAYTSLTRDRPFEMATSRTIGMTDHVTIKPKDQIRVESFVPTLHSAALMLIDAINADGTLNGEVYDFMRGLNAERAPYEEFLGGELLADVAIYYDKESMYNPDENGVHVSEVQASDELPHRDAVVEMANILREGHVPFGVVTNATLHQLGKYRAVIVPNVLEMKESQAAVFRQFVEDGGVLYASGPSSLDRFHEAGPRYLLEDVLGVRYMGTLGTRVTYLTPVDEAVAKTIWPQDHLIFGGPMIQAEMLPEAEALATVTLPFTAPEAGRAIGSRFAAIISDPPAVTAGSDPGIVVHSYGKGNAVWVAAPIESVAQQVNARLVLALLKRLLPKPYKFEAETHSSIEVTLFDQPENQRLLLGMLNMQSQLPAVPVGATIKVQLPHGRVPSGVFRIPDREPIAFKRAGPYVEIGFEPFETLAMALVEYE